MDSCDPGYAAAKPYVRLAAFGIRLATGRHVNHRDLVWMLEFVATTAEPRPPEVEELAAKARSELEKREAIMRAQEQLSHERLDRIDADLDAGKAPSVADCQWVVKMADLDTLMGKPPPPESVGVLAKLRAYVRSVDPDAVMSQPDMDRLARLVAAMYDTGKISDADALWLIKMTEDRHTRTGDPLSTDDQDALMRLRARLRGERI